MHRPDHRRLRAALAAGIVLVVAVLATASAPTPLAALGSGVGVGTGAAGQTLTVTPTTGLDPDGEVVTVTGAGFDADAGFDVASAGLYVAFCVDNGPGRTPSPCVGGVDLSGGSGSSRWVTNDPIPGSPAVPIAADGSFSTTIEVARADQFVDCATLAPGKACKVTVRMDHRAGGDRTQDVKVPVTFGAPAPAGPTLAVTPSTGLDPAGSTVTVTGTGYPTEGPGLYVVYGPPPANSTDATPYGAVAVVDPSAIGADGGFTVTLPGVRAAYTGANGVAYDFTDGGGRVSTFRAQGRPDPDGRWVASVPVSFAGAAVPASSTTLAVAPTSVETGRGVVMTATVTAQGAPVTSGTVDLRVGTTSLGTATLGADGRATRTTSFASAGTRSVTAHFLGSDQALASTSAPVAVTVTDPAPPPPPPTTQPEPPDTEPTGTGTGTGVNGQTLTATPVENLDPEGTEVAIDGAGFSAAAGFDTARDGLYLSFCVDRGDGSQPTPCIGGADSEGGSGSSRWVTNDPYEGVPADAVTPIAADGTFSTRITVKAADEFVDCLDLPAGQRCVIVARMDHRATADRTQDVKVQVCFAGEAACRVAPQTIDPTQPGTGPAPFTGFPLAPATAAPAGTVPGTTQLARTGFEGRDLVPAALALLGVGGLLVAWSRRRSALAVVPLEVER